MDDNLRFHLADIVRLVLVQLYQLLPFWFGGTLAGSLISVYGMESVKRLAGKMRGGSAYHFGHSVTAAFLGIASPVCMYGTVPVIAALFAVGVPDYILVNFMVASILLNPNLLFMSFALGYPLALTRFVAVIIAGLLAGFLVWRFRLSFFDFSRFQSTGMTDNVIKPHKTLIRDLGKSMGITAPYFVFGMLLTALIDKFMPEAFFDFIFRQNRALSVLFMASAGVPAYLCGGGTIPLLRDWLSEGMNSGAAVAFMLSGPAAKLTNISAVKAILGVKNIALYLIFMLGFSIMMGYLTNFLAL